MRLPPDDALVAIAQDDGPGRRLACAVLLLAATDAHRGDVDAREWLASGYARRLARAVDVFDWPPAPSQMATKRELIARSRELDFYDVDSLRGLSLPWQRYRRRRLERAGGNGHRKARPRPVRISTAGSAGSSANWGRG